MTLPRAADAVALFNTRFLPYSQTFVYEEIRRHERYAVEVFCRSRLLPERFPFEPVPRGEDTRFLSDVIESGARIYSSDRFNYCQMRGADVSSHTWPITNEELLASSKIQFFGSPEDHISV